MENLPSDVLILIFNRLDIYSKISYLHVCKDFNNIVDTKEKYDVLDKIKEDQIKLRNNRKTINSIMTRNLYVDDYTLYGECELCNKKGFLRYQEIEGHCICLEHCVHTCIKCQISKTYNNNNILQIYPKCRNYCFNCLRSNVNFSFMFQYFR